jgi:hypothetical protein
LKLVSDDESGVELDVVSPSSAIGVQATVGGDRVSLSGAAAAGRRPSKSARTNAPRPRCEVISPGVLGDKGEPSSALSARWQRERDTSLQAQFTLSPVEFNAQTIFCLLGVAQLVERHLATDTSIARVQFVRLRHRASRIIIN